MLQREVVMNPTGYNAARTYASVGLESEVQGADPHGLILLLYRGAIAALVKARGHMQRNEFAEKGAAISNAVAIINDGLRASLDLNQGGEIAANLDALYEYMAQQLLVANIKNQPELIDEIGRLLADLKGAWETIGKTGRPAEQQTDQQPQAQRAAISYGKV
jgi:flagellar protein FliS